MFWQDGGMVDDGAMFRVVDDIHGNELGTKWQHIEVSSKRLVLLKHLWRDEWAEVNRCQHSTWYR